MGQDPYINPDPAGTGGARRWVRTPAAVAAGTFATTAQPEIPAEGGLLLRPWQDADAPVFLGAYQDPDIQRWHTRRPATEDDVREWFDRYRRDWEQEKAAHWAVTQGGVVRGRIALGSMNFDDGVAGCGYWVLPSARGAGVASSALTALSDWALRVPRFHRLHLDHSTRNPASCRVAHNAGFRLEGTKRSDAVHADGRHDMHLHARVRGDAAPVRLD